MTTLKSKGFYEIIKSGSIQDLRNYHNSQGWQKGPLWDADQMKFLKKQKGTPITLIHVGMLHMRCQDYIAAAGCFRPVALNGNIYAILLLVDALIKMSEWHKAVGWLNQGYILGNQECIAKLAWVQRNHFKDIETAERLEGLLKKL